MDDLINANLVSLMQDEKYVNGVLIADKQGLCIKAVGSAKEESSGTITAIIDLIRKMEPDKKAPEVIFESDSKCCLIYSGTNTNAAVFMSIPY